MSLKVLQLCAIVAMLSACSTTARRQGRSQMPIEKLGTKTQGTTDEGLANAEALPPVGVSPDAPSDSATDMSESSDTVVENQNTAEDERSAAGLREADAQLIAAQTLADNRRFVDAIAAAREVSRDNPLYAEAQQKVVQFSNDAVQELRKKAAQAFQESMPVGDAKTRAAYLQKAKQHLEYALTSYPDAAESQLSTVRDNLVVISRNLESISGAD